MDMNTKQHADLFSYVFQGEPLGQILQLSDRGAFSVVLHQIGIWRSFSAFSLLSPCFSYCFQYAVMIECRTMLLRGSGAAPFQWCSTPPRQGQGSSRAGRGARPVVLFVPVGAVRPDRRRPGRRVGSTLPPLTLTGLRAGGLIRALPPTRCPLWNGLGLA